MTHTSDEDTNNKVLVRPKFSILIPAYNAESTLAECLQSCVDQTLAPYEILVGDDGSTDNTYAVASSFAPQVRVVKHRNIGQSGTLNRLADLASGDYLVLLDADDWNAPNRLEAIAKLIMAEQYELITHDAWHVFPDGSRSRHYDLVPWHSDSQLHHLALGNFVFGNPAIMRSLWQRLSGLDPNIPLGEDYDFWLRALSSGVSIALLPEPIYFYRCHDKSKTADQSAMEGLEERILRQHLASGNLDQQSSKVVRRALKIRSRSIQACWRRLDTARKSGTFPKRSDLGRIALHPRTSIRPRLKALAALGLRTLWLRPTGTATPKPITSTPNEPQRG